MESNSEKMKTYTSAMQMLNHMVQARAKSDKEKEELMYDVLDFLSHLTELQPDGKESRPLKAILLSASIEQAFNIKLEDRYAQDKEA